MNRKGKIIVSVVGIFIILLALVGITYGYFLTRIQGNTNTTSISVTTADLKLVYADGSPNIVADRIEPGETISSKIFTVANEGNATVENYNVYLENVINQIELKDDVTYTLTCKEYTITDYNTNKSGATKLRDCNGASETVFPSVMSIIATNTIAEGNIHVYEINVVYEDTDTDQSIDMNKTIDARINIYDSKIKFLANEIMTNVKKTGTFTYNKTTYIEPSLQDGIQYTIPAEEISSTNERVMSYTFDDYGTSYYYRGNVEDNYVNFAGMCFRIVRIEGAGSVKLILEDQYTECDDTPTNNKNNDNITYTGAWDIPASDGDTITMNGTEPYRTGNFGYDAETYSGKQNINYLNPVTESKRSMVNAFKYFQKSNLNRYLDNLRSGNWCYNDIAYSDAAGKNIINKEDYYRDSLYFYYDTYVRLFSSTEKNSSLKCNGTKLNYYNDNLNMYVSAITADELMYIGYAAQEENVTYLTSENNKSFWSFSFRWHDSWGDYTFLIPSYGLNVSYVGYNGFSFRPLVVLNSNITVKTGGVGTQTNPYVID